MRDERKNEQPVRATPSMTMMIRLSGFAPECAASLAAALRGFGFTADETQPGEACLAVIAAAAAPEEQTVPRDGALILIGTGPAANGAAEEAPGAHRFPLPFRLGALIALLKRLEQRRAADRPGESVGPYRFHAAERLLLHEQSGEIVRLTDKEAALLAALAEAGGAPVARERLLEDVWGYGDRMTTHTLETHIYRLRQKLGGDADAAALLEQSDDGYRLVK